MLHREKPNPLLQRRKQELLMRYVGKSEKAIRRLVTAALGEFKIMREMTIEDVERVIQHIDALPITMQGGIFDFGDEVAS
ncbi:hypothetical protein CIG75_19200 [Tumebacillus algifaecis]|uniref:Uncharacterized protein n=1 Tax=Tumebacillus algifaecis TaxID=1214604 RepID=A0A223D5L9_9BACL|nr:hypothetical protein [Tumebacillus algifaecis]ASS76861.1 hypothetical protein CIG75_19200 [Tumebacillus algifaecis]